MKEVKINRQMTKEEIRELVAKAVCEGIELTPGDFETKKDETKAYAEHLIQLRFLNKEGFR